MIFKGSYLSIAGMLAVGAPPEAFAWCYADDELFVWNATSAASPDSQTTFALPAGAPLGRWSCDPSVIAASMGQFQMSGKIVQPATTYFVNAATGNDNNPGTASAPVRTYLFGIRQNKFNGGAGPYLVGNVTIQYQTDPAPDDQLLLDNIESDTGQRELIVNLIPVVLATFVVVASTNANRPVNTPYQIQAVGLGAALRGRVYVITTPGPLQGVSGVIGSDQGGGNVRSTGPILTGLGLPAFSPPVTLPVLGGETIAVQRGGAFALPLIIRGGSFTPVINDAQFPSNAFSIIGDAISGFFGPILNRCEFLGGLASDGLISFYICQSCTFGGLCNGGQLLGCYFNQVGMAFPIAVDFDCVIEGVPGGFSLMGFIPERSVIGTLGIFDNGSSATIAMFDGASIETSVSEFSGVGSIYGTGNAGTTIFRVERGPLTAMGYAGAAAPPITGPAEAAAYLLLSGVAKTRAQVNAGPGIVDVVHQTMMVPSA